MRSVLVIVTVLILVVGASLYFGNSTLDRLPPNEPKITEQGSSNGEIAKDSLPTLVDDASDFAGSHIGSVIQRLESTEELRLQPWLDEVFLPRERFALRHRLVSIDRDNLENAINRSWGRDNSLGNNYASDESHEILFELFPGFVYEVSINRVTEGRYGHLHANGVVTNSNPLNSNVDISIGPDSIITGTFVTSEGHYSIRPAKEIPYYVVVQIDSAKASRVLKVN